MKELGKWQIISMLSQGVAMLLGLVETFLVIRILSVGEWGLVQLAVSIGGALGIYQHLGLVSASTREISSAKKEEDIFKIFVTSTVIRYFVTLPISLGLFFFSRKIAVGLYNNPELIFPLKIYAVALVFQGVQGILNSVISGTKRFKHLFIYQVAISVVNILIFVPFVYFFKVPGYFYGFLIFNIISTITLSVIAFKPLRGKISMPDKADFTRLFKEIFSISIAIYVVKIIYTNWEKMGNNVLGIFNPPEVIAVFAFAMLYAKKLMSISDSVTTVNIPVFSERFVNDVKEFKESFTRNFNKLFSLIVFIGAFASYLAPILIRILVGGDKYDNAIPLITPMVFAFVIYSLINIVSSSVLIPAKEARSMIYSYLVLILGTAVSFLLARIFTDAVTAFSWAMVLGSLFSLYYMHYLIKKKHGFEIINIDHIAILIQAVFIGLLCNLDILWIKLVGLVPFALLLGWSIFIAGFVGKSDIISIQKKFVALISRKR
jgi:O-antigen/teichoic acid export membrane protein